MPGRARLPARAADRDRHVDRRAADRWPTSRTCSTARRRCRATAPRWSACAAVDSDYDNPPRYSLWLIDLASGEGRELVADPDLWPGAPQFSADGSAVFFTADQQGHRPVFRVDVASGDITRVTATGHYTNVQVHPDGATLFALRDAVD